MNALLEELLEKEETTELELCILWVADDAEKWEEGDMPYEHAAKAAAELAALRARVAELERFFNEVEWCGDQDRFVCPDCGNYKEQGHRISCRYTTLRGKA